MSDFITEIQKSALRAVADSGTNSPLTQLAKNCLSEKEDLRAAILNSGPGSPLRQEIEHSLIASRTNISNPDRSAFQAARAEFTKAFIKKDDKPEETSRPTRRPPSSDDGYHDDDYFNDIPIADNR